MTAARNGHRIEVDSECSTSRLRIYTRHTGNWAHRTSHRPLNTSHITQAVEPITHYTAHLTHHTSHRPLSTALITQPIEHITHHTSHWPLKTSHITSTIEHATHSRVHWIHRTSHITHHTLYEHITHHTAMALMNQCRPTSLLYSQYCFGKSLQHRTMIIYYYKIILLFHNK